MKNKRPNLATGRRTSHDAAGCRASCEMIEHDPLAVESTTKCSSCAAMFTGITGIAGVALVLAAATVAAQDSAVESAADAFGERVGTEQSGLYSESQVRGFNLNDSGAYRIDDAYFSRAAALNDPVLAGVGVRVGVNAVRLAYPACRPRCRAEGSWVLPGLG
jgi:hypothetical protein